MKIKFNKKVGDQQIEIEHEVANLAEFFQFKAMWDSIPEVGPNGQTDLKFSYRTPQGYEYYAIECPSAGKEFKFGQPKNEKTRLFPKEWAPIMHGREEFEEEPPPEPTRQAHTQSARTTSPTPVTAQRPAPTSSASVTDIDSKKYFDFQRENHLSFKQAEEIRLECTINKKTDWVRAFERLRQLVKPAGFLTPGQLSLTGIFAALKKLGVNDKELETKLSRICDGVCEIESLDETQTAKAISVFNRDLINKQGNQQRTA